MKQSNVRIANARILSVILAACFVLMAVPFGAVDEAEAETYGNALEMTSPHPSYIEVQNMDHLNIADEITVEAWVHPYEHNPNWAVIAMKGSNYILALTDKGEIFFMCDSLQETGSITSDFIVPENEWSHIAGTYKDGQIRVYYNGAEQTKNIHDGPLRTNSQSLWIGNYSMYDFNGIIDEVRILDVALSKGMIQSDSGSIEYPAHDSTVLWYHLDEVGAGQTAIDYSPYNTPGQILGTVRLVPRDYSVGTIDVTYPNQLEHVQKGMTRTITWETTGIIGTQVKIELYQVGIYLTTLVSSTLNDGEWEWYLAQDLSTGSQSVRITSLDHPSVYTERGLLIIHDPYNGYTLELSDDHVSIPEAGYLDITGEFTIEAWINPETHNTIIASKGYNYVLSTDATGLLFFYCNDTVLQYDVYLASTSSVPLGEWSYVAVTYDGATLRLYLNDEIYTMGVTLNMELNDRDLYIGKESFNEGYEFNGQIDEFRILGDGLSQSEIEQNRLANVFADQPNTLVWFHFEEITSEGKVVDSSSYGVDGAIHGDPQLVPKIFPYGEVTVITPNGPEYWQRGTTKTITWTSYGFMPSVNIDLHQNGAFLENLVEDTADDGTYDWNIPSDINGDYNFHIKITSGLDNNVWDISDAYFDICEDGTITVTKPNGGNRYPDTGKLSIRWDSEGPVSSVDIYLYKNGVEHYTIVEDTTDDGAYNWPIASSIAPGTDYTVKIISHTNDVVCDESDEYFEIFESGTIDVTSPTGQSSWEVGNTENIEWTANGDYSGYVDIKLYNGGAYVTTIASDIDGSGGQYNWQIPTDLETRTDYSIKVIDSSYSAILDESSYFDIHPYGEINVFDPYVGDIWGVESTQAVQWTYSGHTSGNVKVELYKGESYYKTLSSSTPISDRYIIWTIPTYTQIRDDYNVRVSDVDHNSISDTSGDFEIVPIITLTSLSDGENVFPYKDYDITWETAGYSGNYVAIYLYRNGQEYDTLVGSTSNDGSWPWDVSSSLPTGGNYKIMIEDTTYNVADFSNEYFGLVEPESGQVVELVGSQSVLVPRAEHLDIEGDEFTIEAWIMPYSYNIGLSAIVTKGDNYYFGMESDGSLYFKADYRWDTSIDYEFTSDLVVPTGEWSHVAVTYDDVWLIFYLNGVEDRHFMPNMWMVPDPAKHMGIGCYLFTENYWQQGDFFQGQIDEVRMLSQALSPEEIREDGRVNEYEWREYALLWFHFEEPDITPMFTVRDYSTYGVMANQYGYMWGTRSTPEKSYA